MLDQEIRRVVGDTTYWLRANGALWLVTANGQPITWPTDYASALAALEAVAPAT